MMMLPLTILIIFLFLAYMQRAHYEFELEKLRKKASELFKTESEEKRKELDDLKKRVDALTLRAGFKV